MQAGLWGTAVGSLRHRDGRPTGMSVITISLHLDNRLDHEDLYGRTNEQATVDTVDTV